LEKKDERFKKEETEKELKAAKREIQELKNDAKRY